MRTFLIALLCVLGSQAAFGRTLYTFNGGGTGGTWSDKNIWTTDPTGSTSVSPGVPQNNDVVVITNSFVVQLSADVATTGLDVTVQRGGQLDLGLFKFTNTLARLAGQGTMRIKQSYFPTVTTNDFDDAGAGTVEFYDWAAGTAVLPTGTTTYNNLRLLNTTQTAYVAQLNHNLTLNGNLLLTTTTNAAAALSLGSAAGNRTLTVMGNITVGTGTTLGVSNVTGTHVLDVYGSLINNGTVNLHNGTANDNQVAVLTFKGNTEASFACNGPTDLDLLRVNKGLDSQVLLNVTSTTSTTGSQGNLRLNHVGSGDLLILVNGVTKLGDNIYLPRIHNGNPKDLTNSAGWFQLGSSSTSPTLWLDGAAVFNDNSSAGLFVVYGTYRISNGSLSSMCDGGMVVREDGQVLVTGGTTSVNKFRPSSTSSAHRGSFIMTGGVFESLGSVASTFDDQFSRFAVPYVTQSIRMTGGTLRVRNPTRDDGLFHIGVNPDNAIITGGTIELLLPDNNINGKILSTSPLWNLTIRKLKFTNNSTSKAILSALTIQSDFASGATLTAQPLTVLNDFTLTANDSVTLKPTNPVVFDAANLNLAIQGTLNIGEKTTYLPGTNTTIFSGGQNQLLTNNGTIGTNNTFYSWTMDKPAGTLTLAGSATTFNVNASGTLSLLNGVLSDGGKTINVLGNIVNSASHTSAGGNGSITLAGSGNQTISGNDKGVFGNLRINSTAAAGTVAVTMTANMAVASTLTMMSNTILNIGANRLALTNVISSGPGSALMLGPDLTSFSNSCFIQTAGNQSDLGLQKTYGKGDSFLFPVGTITVSGNTTTVRYAPATIQLQLASSAPLDKFGQISVSPVASRNPFVASTANSLAYYWKVRSVGFGTIPTGSINETFRMTNTDAAGTLSSYVPGRYLPTAWTSYSGTVSAGNSSSDIAFSGLDDFAGEFTAGAAVTFGPITAYYSVKNGSWADASTWKTVNGTTTAAASSAPASNNPVFIGLAADKVYHTVTVAANNARAGSLVIDRGSVLDVGSTTGHNFGALPDAKVGGAGRLRVSTSATTGAVTFPGGDFGSFIQENGGTVEYYTTGAQNLTVPTASGSLTLNQYRNLWLNAGSGRTVSLPNQNLRVYAQLKAGVANGGTTYPGTVLLSTAANGNLRVDSLLAVQAGTLSYNNGTARTLTADTDVLVENNATLNVTADNTAVANALTIGRSLTNNGTLLLLNGTRRVNLTFTSDQNANFTGTNGGAATTLATLTLNKGLDQKPVLNLDVAGSLSTPTSSWLTLTNGTLRYAKPSSTLTIHDANSPYLITDNAALTIDAPSANVTVATNTAAPNNTSSALADLKLAGLLQVLQGSLSVGTTTGLGNDLEYASAGAPTIRVGTGGKLYVNGQLRRTTANTNGSLRYDQTGGEVTIDGARATVANNKERGLFEVQGPGSIFRMSGGTLALRGSNKNPAIIADLYVRPDSTVVTGGTALLGSSGTSALTVSVESLVPLWDLQVLDGPSSAGTNTGMLTGVNPLSLKGSLTITGSNAVFNANGLGLNIDQNLVNNNASTSIGLNSGGFWAGTTAQTTTFTGKGPAVQKLQSTTTNLTVFGSLTVNNSQAGGTLLLERNARATGMLTIAKGTLADNGQTLTVEGDVVNSATHTSTGSGSLVLAGKVNQNVDGNNKGRFGNLTLSNAAGATTLANHEITGVLTLNGLGADNKPIATGVLTIGSNQLWLSNTATGAVTGYDGTHFIRTNGIVADLGLRKSYDSGAQDFTFPVGAAAKYTPVRMNVTANGAAGTLTVKPVDLAHPSTTDNANQTEISFYWKVSSTGFSQPTVDHYFTYASDDVSGTEASYQLGRFVSGAWVPKGGLAPTTLNTSTHTISKTGLTYFDGDYTAGYSTEFGDVPTYYSRNATATQAAGGANWNDASAWTFKSDGSDDVPAKMPATYPTTANPVVIRAGHLITSNGPGRGAATLQLLGTLDLAANAANNFNVVTGTGTVRIGSTLFPAGNYAAFVDAGGGTVEYTSDKQLPARDTYNNLTFSGGNAKLLSNLDLTINGTLTVEDKTTVSNPTSQAITLTSGTLGMTVKGTFNLGDGPLATTAGLATTSTGTLNLGAGATTVGTSFVNEGTLNLGSGDLQVGTSLSNKKSFNANTGAGNVGVGTTFSNSGTYTAGRGRLLVKGDFTNEGPGSFANATGDVSTQGNFVNYGTYGNEDGIAHTLRIAGSFSNLTTTLPGQRGGTSAGLFRAAGSSIVAINGDFTNTNGAGFEPNQSLVQLFYDEPHTLTGTTTFFNLQKGGLSLLRLGTSTDITVGGVLTMRNGLVVTGTANTVRLINPSTQPIVGSSASSYIAGRLAMNLPNEAAAIRVFPVGLGGRYRPVTIKPVSASTSPVVLVEIFNSAPQGPLATSLSNISANRYYRIHLLSGRIGDPTVQLSFNTDVEDEKVKVPGNLRVARSTGTQGTWQSTNGSGVFSPSEPSGYTTSAATVLDNNSYFALASTNFENNPLTGQAPLPVQLLHFAAARQGSQVRLSWATASELRSSHFVVQRSADGSTFADVQQVAAQGSTATRHDYTALDAAPLPGLSYYRLKQVDQDGSYAYSPVASVRFDGAGAAPAPALLAHPNPSTGQRFSLQATNLATTGGTVQLFDNVGRLLLTQTVATGASDATIRPAQLLPSGLYFATWQAPDGTKLSVKVVVE